MEHEVIAQSLIFPLRPKEIDMLQGFPVHLWSQEMCIELISNDLNVLHRCICSKSIAPETSPNKMMDLQHSRSIAYHNDP
jgi:hypothetical protein